MKVLVVDDEAIARMVIGRSLSAQSWEVRHARGYLQALEITAAWTPDVLVCDWKLGTGTGAQVVRVLRESHPELPVVFVSAMPREMLEPEAADIPNCVFVEKPFDTKGMGELIRTVATRSGVAAGQADDDPAG